LLCQSNHNVVAPLEEQDSTIRKVSDEFGVNKPAPQIVLNNR